MMFNSKVWFDFGMFVLSVILIGAARMVNPSLQIFEVVLIGAGGMICGYCGRQFNGYMKGRGP